MALLRMPHAKFQMLALAVSHTHNNPVTKPRASPTVSWTEPTSKVVASNVLMPINIFLFAFLEDLTQVCQEGGIVAQSFSGRVGQFGGGLAVARE